MQDSENPVDQANSPNKRSVWDGEADPGAIGPEEVVDDGVHVQMTENRDNIGADPPTGPSQEKPRGVQSIPASVTMKPHAKQQQAANSALSNQASSPSGTGNLGPGKNPGAAEGADSKHAQSSTQEYLPKEDNSHNQNEKYGLHGLAEIVRMSNKDSGMFAFGCDFSGHNTNPTGVSSWKLFSPFVDTQPQSSSFEPENALNSSPKPPPNIIPAIKRMASYSDETLFYVFYTLTRDILQEAAAQELYNRNWRFHKELRLWLSRDATSETAKGVGFERSVFVFFDPGIWSYVKKEWILYYNQLEERGPLST